jgi:hypothetical protein
MGFIFVPGRCEYKTFVNNVTYSFFVLYGHETVTAEILECCSQVSIASLRQAQGPAYGLANFVLRPLEDVKRLTLSQDFRSKRSPAQPSRATTRRCV